MNNRQFTYIPSFDTSCAANAGRKNFKLKDGTPWRFWSNEYPKKYQHKSFLLTAGHSYKHPDRRQSYEFPEDMLVFGDSGGFQICTGAIKWDTNLRPIMLEWLENNSTVAMNLDIPPRAKMNGRFNECLQISNENFKYFADNRLGKTQLLNIIQGIDIESYSIWYETVKQYTFDGWAIGGAGGSLPAVLSGLSVLIQNGELHKPQTKWLHILGASGVMDFLLFSKIQLELNRRGLDVMLTTDSSTPSRSSTFGMYYMGFDIKDTRFRYINLPRREKLHHNAARPRPPIVTEIDEIIWRNYTIDEFTKWTQYEYAWLVSHNFAIFKDCYTMCNELIYTDSYLWEQMLPQSVVVVLNSIAEMFDAKSATTVYHKYKPLYADVSRLITQQLEPSSTFF